jgi:hypothetical protein
MEKLNKFVLRRLYNKGNIGRGEEGVSRRKEFKITLTPNTYLALSKLIPVGPGQYGSPVMELSLRMMLASMGSLGTEDYNRVCEELALTVVDHDSFIQELARISAKVADIIAKTKTE